MEGLKINRELVLEFFLNFSRFEFALKARGFAKGDENSVSPDWDGYATSIKGKFNKSVNENLLNESNYLLENPPWKQVLLPSGLAWSSNLPNNNLTELEILLILVRRVRNNLFHGGKHNLEVFEQIERTEHLLKSCLIILDACLCLSPDVKRAFNEAVI